MSDAKKVMDKLSEKEIEEIKTKEEIKRAVAQDRTIFVKKIDALESLIYGQVSTYFSSNDIPISIGCKILESVLLKFKMAEVSEKNIEVINFDNTESVKSEE